MDVISEALSLRQQLVALDNSNSTISLLDGQLEFLGGQSLLSAIEENQSHHLRLLLRVSVTEGVRHIYQQYSNTKWAQVSSLLLSFHKFMS
ncbi:uncharacterized protein LOC123549231 [Mercenaria mercenaria]|uniref:uncharacterized protein LOC123549231 n=1 Tax=Mercenaria mercenaria TaxID=6596 RepID=UPI00234EFC45|nr:uncharacterized protein LOC123549231 [Mercenaria mercenaria]